MDLTAWSFLTSSWVKLIGCINTILLVCHASNKYTFSPSLSSDSSSLFNQKIQRYLFTGHTQQFYREVGGRVTKGSNEVLSSLQSKIICKKYIPYIYFLRLYNMVSESDL